MPHQRPQSTARHRSYTSATGAFFAAVLLSLHTPAQTHTHPFPRESNSSLPPRSLCMATPDDLSRDIKGSLQYGPPPTGGTPFPESIMEEFPYASKDHCHEHTESLHLVPDDCELTALDPLTLLEQIRGRRMVFWGDSVMRQFMAYLVLRLKQHETHEGFDLKGNYQDHPEADPELCRYSKELNSYGLELDPACFSLESDAFREQQACFWYLEDTTALCYVKVTTAIVDNKNVVFWNELTPNDIVLMNVGLHHNRRGDMKHALLSFAQLLAYTAKSRPLPLMIWRETSAQHFRGGDGGNYLMKLSSELRSVDPNTFRCTKYPFQIMKDADWRNRYVNEMGFVGHKFRVDFPILKVWNTTAMAYWLHPRTHGQRTDHAVADCSHFCPNYGGMFEVWSTLLQNFLAAAQPLATSLAPRVTVTSWDLRQHHRFMKARDHELRDEMMVHRAEILAALQDQPSGRTMMDATPPHLMWWQDQL